MLERKSTAIAQVYAVTRVNYIVISEMIGFACMENSSVHNRGIREAYC